jgi:hypothetical protein
MECGWSWTLTKRILGGNVVPRNDHLLLTKSVVVHRVDGGTHSRFDAARRAIQSRRARERGSISRILQFRAHQKHVAHINGESRGAQETGHPKRCGGGHGSTLALGGMHDSLNIAFYFEKHELVLLPGPAILNLSEDCRRSKATGRVCAALAAEPCGSRSH